MSLIENNMNGNISHVRDTFLSAELEYVQDVISNKAWLKFIIDLNQIDSEILYRSAMKLIDEVEYGCINYEDMNGIETELIAILSAIKDVTLKKELVLTPDYEEEHTLRKRR